VLPSTPARIAADLDLSSLFQLRCLHGLVPRQASRDPPLADRADFVVLYFLLVFLCRARHILETLPNRSEASRYRCRDMDTGISRNRRARHVADIEQARWR
jgi:hypothetical protein